MDEATEIQNPNWAYFAPSNFGGVSIVVSPNDEWVINNNGNITEGDFDTILLEAINIAKRN